MPKPTLLFVHGTGVREQSYTASIELMREKAAEAGLDLEIDDCLWGAVLGIDFKGLSLPKLREPTEAEKVEAERWDFLAVDPLFELKLWCTPANEVDWSPLLGESPSQSAWNVITAYQPSAELKALLQPLKLEDAFASAWKTVLGNSVSAQAFQGGGAEDAAISRAFAEAVVAQMVHETAIPVALPLRKRLMERMLYDWKQAKLGIKDLLAKIGGYGTKVLMRPLRTKLSHAIAPAIGDILLYQSNGAAIQQLIRKKIEELPDPAYVLAHSLGGIACVDIFASDHPPKVKGLITCGSQAPLMHEFGALTSMVGKTDLPDHFPPWLNIYDENDALSYVAGRLFKNVEDLKVDSVLPPLEAHSAYWTLPETWTGIKTFLEANP